MTVKQTGHFDLKHKYEAKPAHDFHLSLIKLSKNIRDKNK